MATAVSLRPSLKRFTRVVHVCWITAVIFFVATPDGEIVGHKVASKANASRVATR